MAIGFSFQVFLGPFAISRNTRTLQSAVLIFPRGSGCPLGRAVPPPVVTARAVVLGHRGYAARLDVSKAWRFVRKLHSRLRGLGIRQPRQR